MKTHESNSSHEGDDAPGTSEVGRQSTSKFAELIVDTIREALVVLDSDLRVQSASRSFYNTFEVTPSETEGRLIYELGNGQWDIPELRQLLEEILPKNMTMDDFEVEHEFENIGRRVMLLNARQMDEHGLILLAIEDVTERRLMEQQLRESREHFDLLIENAEEYAIFMMDVNTAITSWNSGAERILGWKEDEIIGRSGSVIFAQEDREAGVPEAEVQLSLISGSARDDRWHVRKDGTRFWGTGFMVSLREDGELRGFAKILRDDTRTKEAEQEREALLDALEDERRRMRELNETLEERVAARTKQVRDLASTLTVAEQRERRRISQMLHDDLQQVLYAMQMKLAYVRKAAVSEDRVQVEQHSRQLDEWLTTAIQTTRRLTVDLSPPVLEGRSLTDALVWLAGQMQDLHELEVDVQAEHSFALDHRDVRLLLFQVVRELLFNVVKHANTRHAGVELEQLNGDFVIRVIDMGQGFDVDDLPERAQGDDGFGLFSVRERVNLVGGRMEIRSTPGEGTRVSIYMPTLLDTGSEAS